jgi:ABC-type transport system involved in multi-copper enzyme maturation permease subunit
VLETVFGPLAGPECRRALGRGWVLVVRWLAILPPAIVLLAVLWTWWFNCLFIADYLPEEAFRIGLQVLEWIFVLLALLLAPALLAGSLAGEKLRGTLGLLLACLVSPLEILVARLVGRLSVLGAIFLGGMPALLFCAGLYGLSSIALLLLVLLPMAMALGGGGLAAGISSMVNRGRDALLSVYLALLVLLLAPVWGSFLPLLLQAWIVPLNPFVAIEPLVTADQLQPALTAIGVWSVLGIVGCAVGAWRLRPSYLHDADGPRPRRWLPRRSIPSPGDRPMAWKEIHVEQAKGFQRVIRWLNILAAALLLGTSLVFGSLFAWWTWWQPDGSAADWAKDVLEVWTGSFWATTGFAWLVQWSMGLRAAVAIAAERERNTWDGLLLTPLEGREIIRAKIYGSVHTWRAFLAAVFIAWTITAACGAMSLGNYSALVAQTLVGGVFTVVVGVWFSLSSSSAARAMTLTLITWWCAAFGIVVLAFIMVGLLGLALALTWLWWKSLTGQLARAFSAGGPGILAWWSEANTVMQLLLYLLAAVLIAFYCWRCFDRLAGRSFATRHHRLPGDRPRRIRSTETRTPPLEITPFLVSSGKNK